MHTVRRTLLQRLRGRTRPVRTRVLTVGATHRDAQREAGQRGLGGALAPLEFAGPTLRGRGRGWTVYVTPFAQDRRHSWSPELRVGLHILRERGGIVVWL